MNVRDALALKDIVVQRSVFRKLAENLTSSEERDKVQETVSDGFKEGERDWLDNYLPIAVPDPEDRESLKRKLEIDLKPK